MLLVDLLLSELGLWLLTELWLDVLMLLWLLQLLELKGWQVAVE